jgi:hypothetical protein
MPDLYTKENKNRICINCIVCPQDMVQLVAKLKSFADGYFIAFAPSPFIPMPLIPVAEANGLCRKICPNAIHCIH